MDKRPDPDSDITRKLDQLDKRIKEARKDQDISDTHSEPAQDHSSSAGKQASSAFLGSVMAGGILGGILGHYTGSAPWGIMICITLGFVGGVYRANAITKKMNNDS